VAAAVQVAEALEKLFAILPAQIVWPLDTEADQLFRDGRANVG
jgi:hypothetical protein